MFVRVCTCVFVQTSNNGIPNEVSVPDRLFAVFIIGGVTAAIIDHSGGFCAWTTLKDRRKLTSTVDLKIDYIRPAPVETLFCDAICTHQGRSLIRV